MTSKLDQGSSSPNLQKRELSNRLLREHGCELSYQYKSQMLEDAFHAYDAPCPFRRHHGDAFGGILRDGSKPRLVDSYAFSFEAGQHDYLKAKSWAPSVAAADSLQGSIV